MSAWRRNAWLAVFGATLVSVAALGADRLVAATAYVYGLLPMLAPVFRSDHERQVRALHPLVMGLGAAALLAYGLASRRSIEIWPRLLPLRGGRLERVRTSAVAAVVVYSILLLSLRVARDVLRERELAGLSNEARRLSLYGVHSREPDYGPIEAFRRTSGGEGALLVARPGMHAPFDDVFLASYLFPQRVYVRPVSECSADVLPRLRAERPTAAWIEWACEDGRFAPEPLAPR